MFNVVCVDTRELYSNAVFGVLSFNDEDAAKKYIWERAHNDVDDMVAPNTVTVKDGCDYVYDADKFAGMAEPDSAYPNTIVITSCLDEDGFISYTVKNSTAYKYDNDILHLIRLRLRRGEVKVECEITWKEDMHKEQPTETVVIGIGVPTDAEGFFFICHSFGEFASLYTNVNEDFNLTKINRIIEEA